MASVALGSTVVRHQLASFAATLVDLSVMVLLVELFRVSPPRATLVGAFSGAIVNFTLNRRHTFPAARSGEVSPQALRYALVSATGAILNATGVKWGTRLFGLPYLVVRAVVAFAVGLGFSYPLHRFFVFRGRSAGS